MKKKKDVIEAYELAPEGIVSQVYPSEGNEEALGLNMLKLPERKREALLAKNSEKYTIAGPYELIGNCETVRKVDISWAVILIILIVMVKCIFLSLH